MAAPSEYPPTEFCRKYGKLLAPAGTLVSPETAFKLYKGPDKQAEAKTRRAFRVILKRLQRQNRLCVTCGQDTETTYGSLAGTCRDCSVACCSADCSSQVTSHDHLCTALHNQRLDQFVECLPSPVSVFAHLDVSGSGCPPAGLSWPGWFSRQAALSGAVEAAVPLVRQWAEFAGLLPAPSPAEVSASLRRIISGLVALPLTLLHALQLLDIRQRVLQLHLVGADLPEVSMVYSGLCRLLSAAAGPPRSVRLTLVSPDRHVCLLSQRAPLTRPMEAGLCQVTAWPGLYHDFHQQQVETGRLPPPHLVVCVHPGLHTPELLEPWTPTLQLLISRGYPTALTTYNQQEHEATLRQLCQLQPPPYRHSGPNSVGSQHVKQTPNDSRLTWASNAYLIIL